MSTASFDLPPRPDRRTAIKWMLAAAATTTLLGVSTRADAEVIVPGTPDVGGYGTDPDMLKTYHPGDVWPLTFTDAQRATAAALCAVIIPADEHSPSAAQVHVQDFIDEWVSAPYPKQKADRPVVIRGLAWLDGESHRRFGRTFAHLSTAQRSAICDDIDSHGPTAPPFREAAKFFLRFRQLTAGGYYTTPEGMRAVGYVGNVALTHFEGPPAAVRRQLGLA